MTTDEPGLPATDDETLVDLLLRLLSHIDMNSEDGRAGTRTILREIRDKNPDALEAMHASLTARRLRLAPLGTQH